MPGTGIPAGGARPRLDGFVAAVPPTPPYVVAITLRFGKELSLQGKRDAFGRREEVKTFGL
jgi:hypothetical protein